MASTVTKKQTLKEAIDLAQPGVLPDALRILKLGSFLNGLLTPVQEEIDISAAAATSVTLTKAALFVQAVTVTDAAGGAEDKCDKVVLSAYGGGSPKSLLPATVAGPIVGSLDALGSCVLAADGTTLTFEKQVKKVKVVYIPRPATQGIGDLAALYGEGAP